MAVALVSLLVGGVELAPGDTIPDRVVFAGSQRPVDVAAMVARGLAGESKRGPGRPPKKVEG